MCAGARSPTFEKRGSRDRLPVVPLETLPGGDLCRTDERHLSGKREAESHSTVTAQPQHCHSTAPAQLPQSQNSHLSREREADERADRGVEPLEKVRLQT